MTASVTSGSNSFTTPHGNGTDYTPNETPAGGISPMRIGMSVVGTGIPNSTLGVAVGQRVRPGGDGFLAFIGPAAATSTVSGGTFTLGYGPIVGLDFFGTVRP